MSVQKPLSEDIIFVLLKEHTTFHKQNSDESMVSNQLGAEMCAQRFVDFVRAIEKKHGIN